MYNPLVAVARLRVAKDLIVAYDTTKLAGKLAGVLLPAGCKTSWTASRCNGASAGHAAAEQRRTTTSCRLRGLGSGGLGWR